MALEVKISRESWPLRDVFRIARGSRTSVDIVVLQISDGQAMGRGECSPSSRYGETLSTVADTINEWIPALAAGIEREELAQRLAAGSARNAIDCALWDLRAKQTGKAVWQLAGLEKPTTLTSAFTLSIDTPDKMARAARANARRPLLKLKLAGDGADLARVEGVREQAPAAQLIVDANEAWSQADYENLMPPFTTLGVAMVEQPFKADQDDILRELARPVPVCADESCHTASSLARLQGRYDMVNIKLDKTGGLSEALRLRSHALEQGFEIMVGCMLGTSLAMAPGLLVAQGARFVDLDGPLLLAKDRRPGLHYRGSDIEPASADLWG